MYSEVLTATTFDRDRVPEAFDAPPIVAVLLPGPKWSGSLSQQDHRSFNYHLLRHKDYDLFHPIAFDADIYVEEVLTYCKVHKVQAVMAFDTFPALLASICREELKLQGPLFKGTLSCTSKFYMRRFITPDSQQPLPKSSKPSSYPVVVKMSDTQFCVGVRICHNEEEWQAANAEFHQGSLGTGREKRKQFYFKWAQRFGVDIGAERWEDVVLVHTEPYIEYVTEHQAEVVITIDGEMLLADTGDIVHMDDGDPITIFKTPGTFEMTPILKKILRDVVDKLFTMGLRSGAVDVEFMRLKCAEECYELVEVNPRYSFMGFFKKELPSVQLSCQGQEEALQPREVRNLLNRTRLSLGALPQTLPCRDQVGVSKIASFIYTDKTGPIDKIIDKERLQGLVDSGTIDAFAPKPVYLKGWITENDMTQFNGWAKIGTLLMTWEDDTKKIINRLDHIMKNLSIDKDRGFLPVHAYQQGDGISPVLKPDYRDLIDASKSKRLRTS